MDVPLIRCTMATTKNLPLVANTDDQKCWKSNQLQLSTTASAQKNSDSIKSLLFGNTGSCIFCYRGTSIIWKNTLGFYYLQ